MKCPSCGNENIPGKFCPMCGALVRMGEAQEPTALMPAAEQGAEPAAPAVVDIPAAAEPVPAAGPEADRKPGADMASPVQPQAEVVSAPVLDAAVPPLPPAGAGSAASAAGGPGAPYGAGPSAPAPGYMPVRPVSQYGQPAPQYGQPVPPYGPPAQQGPPVPPASPPASPLAGHPGGHREKIPTHHYGMGYVVFFRVLYIVVSVAIALALLLVGLDSHNTLMSVLAIPVGLVVYAVPSFSVVMLENSARTGQNTERAYKLLEDLLEETRRGKK